MIDIGGGGAAAAAISDSWPIGDSKLLCSIEPAIAIGLTGVALCRKDAVSIDPKDYPEFYSIIQSGLPNGFWTQRGATGLSTVKAIGYDGANTLVATGVGGISISRDRSKTFAPIAADCVEYLGTPGFINGVWLVTSKDGVLRMAPGETKFTLVPGSPATTNTSLTGVVVAGKKNAVINVPLSTATSNQYVTTDGGLTFKKVSIPASVSSLINFASDKNGQFAAKIDTAYKYSYAYSVDDGLSFNKSPDIALHKEFSNLRTDLSDFVWTGKYFVQGGRDYEASATSSYTEGSPTLIATEFAANTPAIRWAKIRTTMNYYEGYRFMPLCGLGDGLLAIIAPLSDDRYFQNSYGNLYYVSNSAIEKLLGDYSAVESPSFPVNIGAVLVATNVNGVHGVNGACFYLGGGMSPPTGSSFYSHFDESVVEIPLVKWTPPSNQPGANYYTRVK